MGQPHETPRAMGEDPEEPSPDLGSFEVGGLVPQDFSFRQNDWEPTPGGLGARLGVNRLPR